MSVNRLNYGILCKFVTKTRPTTGIWRHTWAIQLPEIIDKREHTTNIFADEVLANVTQDRCSGQADPIIRTFCQQFQPHLRFIQQVANNGRKSVNKLAIDIHSIIPRTTSNTYDQHKRALLPFVGKIFSGLFGTSTQDDVDVLRNHLLEITQNNNQQLQVLKLSAQHMSSFALKTKESLDQLALQVKQTAFDNLDLLQKVSEKISSQMRFQEDITINTLKLQEAIRELTQHYSNYLSAIETVTAGYLPVYLLDQLTVTTALTELQQLLKEENSPYHIIHSHAGWYYKRAAFVYLQHNNMLYISMQIPLTTFQYDFTHYEIKSYPLTMHDESEHVTMLSNVPAGIAVDDSHQFMFTMNEQELQEIGKHEHAITRRVFQLNPENSCIMAIYLDKPQNIHRLCKYTILMNTLQPHITHLFDNTYMLINITTYTLTCHNSVEQKSGCKLCTVKIHANCSVQTDKFYIPPTFTTKTNINKTIEHGYITNLPMLMNFFDNETLSILRGDTFLSLPPQINIPPFAFYKNNATKMFAADENVRADLKKAAQSVITDGLIVNSLTEAVVMGKISVDSNFWISIPGIISELTVFAIVTLIVIVIYLSLKVKKLAIAIAILQASVQPVRSDQPIVFNYYEQLQNPSDSSQQSVHNVIIDTTARIWPYVIASLLALAFLIIAIYKLYKCACKQYLLNNTLSVMLEFSNDTKSVFIPIYKLKGLPQDFIVTATDFVCDIRIEGFWNPQLKYNWSTFKITDPLLSVSFTPPTQHKLDWIAAILLKRVIDDPYTVQPVFVHNAHITRIIIPSPQVPENNTVDIP